MQMILSFADGRRAESVLLAGGEHHMRLAVRNRKETLELQFEAGQWRAEDGSMVEIGAIVWDGLAAIPDARKSAPLLLAACG